MSEEKLTNNNLKEIDLLEILKIIYDIKIIFFSSSFLLGLVFFLYSLSLPDLFESEIKLDTKHQQNQRGSFSSVNSQLSGIASLAGFNFSQGQGDKTAAAIELIKSRDFFKYLMEDESIPKEFIDINYKEELFLEKHSVFLSDLNIEEDPISGFLDISYKNKSPDFAKNYLSFIVEQADKKLRDFEIEEIEEALNFLYNELKVITESDVRLSINQLIKTELQKKMFANISKEYLLKTIDSPYKPKIKSEPNRLNYFIVGILFGIFLNFIYVFYNYFLKRNKEK
tara:strand:- start:3383 stop:4231 length:849 start_codon:yes stop_codon:yes gene_type:complete